MCASCHQGYLKLRLKPSGTIKSNKQISKNVNKVPTQKSSMSQNGCDVYRANVQCKKELLALYTHTHTHTHTAV